MNIVIRADASSQIGSGHIMRCLTLAERLRDYGANVLFICRRLQGDLCDFIEKQSFTVVKMEKDVHSQPTDSNIEDWLGVPQSQDAVQTYNALNQLPYKPDWIIVDHYGISQEWQKAVRPFVSRIMVIDDLADREHDCDLLLDQNYYPSPGARYAGLVPTGCRSLFGPKHALLRKEFFEMVRIGTKSRNGVIRDILLFMGGSDPTNETMKALEGLRFLHYQEVRVHVVVGNGNRQKESIRSYCDQFENINYYCQVDHMARLMNEADIAIGAGGSTAWERCALGLPSIVTIIAENQIEPTESLEKTGSIINLGWHAKVTKDDIAASIKRHSSSPDNNQP